MTNRITLLLLAFLALPAFGQVTTGKPGSPSLDTGETHFPDHLYLLNEGAGTTLEDDGDGGDKDLTFCAGAPDWATDGTHGDYLDFVSANSDCATNTAISGLSGTVTGCVVARVGAGTVARAFWSFTDPSQLDRMAALVFQGDEDIEFISRWDDTQTTVTSTQDGTGGFDLICGKFSDSSQSWSLNGSAWASGANTHTGLVAGVTSFALGVLNTSSPSQFFDHDIVAAWWYAGDKSSADIATIYNSGNPWPIIGVDAASAPTFSANPSCSATTNGVSCTYTASTTSTAYGVGVNPGDGTPTCTQIKAGQNDGGTAAIWTGSDANTGTSDTITVTGSNKPVRMDMHFCLSNGGGDSAVYSGQTDKDRSAKAGFAAVVMASHSSTGICNQDSYFTPDCADGDVIEYEDDTNQSSDCNVSIGTDGDIALTPVSAGNCDGKQTFEASYQDVSSVTDGLFTSPATGNFVTDDTICVNNSAPVAEDPLESPIVWTEDEAITAIDLNTFFTDADGDTLTFTLTTGSWPTGVSQSGTGGKDVTGTPTTEDEDGVTLVITATDDCGDSVTNTLYENTEADVYVVNTWTVPNCVASNVGECADLIVAAAPWRVSDPGLTISEYVCEEGSTVGDIFSQDPAAAFEAGALDEVTATVVMSCNNSSVYGKAVSSTGVLQTIPLADGAAVPATASLKNGLALSEDGLAYVCPWPSTAGVGYVGGIAIREDGCTIVAEQSTIATKYYANGIPVSYRGEVSVTTDAPTVIKNGLGRSGDAISVSGY